MVENRNASKQILNRPPGSPPMVIDVVAPCDIDRDGDCDAADFELVTKAIGECIDGENYNALADADHDGCVTEEDVKQLFPVSPGNSGSP